jgi:hypothetical protein
MNTKQISPYLPHANVAGGTVRVSALSPAGTRSQTFACASIGEGRTPSTFGARVGRNDWPGYGRREARCSLWYQGKRSESRCGNRLVKVQRQSAREPAA